MGLHLEMFVLRDVGDLSFRFAAPVAVFCVNEYMPLNAALTDVTKYHKLGDWGDPQVTPQPVLRGFGLAETLHSSAGEVIDEDNHGNELTFVYASDLAGLRIDFLDHIIGEDVRLDVRAMMAYMGALHPNTPVVLYWI